LIPFIAQNYPHLNVYLGIWESSKYRSATEEQMTKAIELANKYPNIVEYVIVGNECLDRDFADGAVTVDQLIVDINRTIGPREIPSMDRRDWRWLLVK
jgi:exo-beta-1,3-glucanase (GH17 family)